jgi:hypothetical protein
MAGPTADGRCCVRRGRYGHLEGFEERKGAFPRKAVKVRGRRAGGAIG